MASQLLPLMTIGQHRGTAMLCTLILYWTSLSSLVLINALLRNGYYIQGYFCYSFMISGLAFKNQTQKEVPRLSISQWKTLSWVFFYTRHWTWRGWIMNFSSERGRHEPSSKDIPCTIIELAKRSKQSTVDHETATPGSTTAIPGCSTTAKPNHAPQ